MAQPWFRFMPYVLGAQKGYHETCVLGKCAQTQCAGMWLLAGCWPCVSIWLVVWGGEVKTNIRQDSGSTFDSDKFGRHFTWLLFWVNHSVIFESHSLHYQGRPCATTSARAEGTESDANGLGGVQFWRLESSRQA